MPLLQELDTGTPIRTGKPNVTLTIDGRKVSVPPGTSVMAAAALIDNLIPKLCATDNLEAFGSCRLCLVEIEGRKGTPASCTTPAEEGMVVHTRTARLERLRRGVMELYISDHPLDCLTCSANGDCELQTQAGNVGLRDVRYGYDGANHLKAPTDGSNPYFTFESSKCIVCSRCVRACEEVQGTFALTILGRGFDSKVAPGGGDFLSSECVSCGACVQACPTATLNEKAVIDKGTPERSVVTTCAYCGVGCAFKAELKGDEVLRMIPYKAGKANEGHSCVKGRFAYGYATHKDRILKPMIRERIDDPWREVAWDEALHYAASEFKRIQADTVAIRSAPSRRRAAPNEEVFLVQKLVRAGFGNNNVDTCARVCHSPTGFGLSKTYRDFGGHAGFQVGRSAPTSCIVIGANPTDAHPVFASRLKKRLRAGARLIVIDPRRIDLVRSPHVEADYHLALRPGTNVAVLNALAHVVVTEGLVNEDFVRERCDPANFKSWARFVAEERHSPEAVASATGVDPQRTATRRAALCDRRQWRDLLRPRRHRARAGLDGGHGDRQSRHGDRQYRPRGRRRESSARPEQRAGLLRYGLVPARVLGLSSRLGRRDAGNLRTHVGRAAQQGAGPAHSQHDGRGDRRLVQGPLHSRRGHRPVRPRHKAHHCGPARDGMRDRAGPLPQRDRALRAMFSCPAPRSSRRTAPSPMPNAASAGCARRSSRSPARPTGRRRSRFANAMGVPMRYSHPSEIMDEIAATTPTFAGRVLCAARRARLDPMALQRRRRRPARRSCMSSASSAARASSC